MRHLPIHSLFSTNPRIRRTKRAKEPRHKTSNHLTGFHQTSLFPFTLRGLNNQREMWTVVKFCFWKQSSWWGLASIISLMKTALLSAILSYDSSLIGCSIHMVKERKVQKTILHNQVITNFNICFMLQICTNANSSCVDLCKYNISLQHGTILLSGNNAQMVSNIYLPSFFTNFLDI